jgi:hypothetical protein
MEYFRDEKGRLVTEKQFNSALNRISPFKRFRNNLCYKRHMRQAYREIFRSFKERKDTLYFSCDALTKDEICDVVERLRFEGYKVQYSISCKEITIFL